MRSSKKSGLVIIQDNKDSHSKEGSIVSKTKDMHKNGIKNALNGMEDLSNVAHLKVEGLS